MNISKDNIRKKIRSKWMNARRKTRKVLLRLPIIFFAAGMVLSIFSGIRIYQIRDTQRAQIAAERWAGESGVQYRQISCFTKGQQQTAGGPDLYLTPDISLNLTEIEAIRKNLDTTVKTSLGMEDEKTSGNPNPPQAENEGSRLWIDTYSAQVKCSIQRPKTDTSLALAKDVTLTGVGGDFYLIHPMILESGAFLAKDTPDTKKIVLDTELAFYFFGTYNVVGEKVFIAEREYTIVGVVRHSASEIDNKTQGEYMRAYVLFPELSYLANTGEDTTINQETGNLGLGADTGKKTTDLDLLAVTCYEVVIPNQISGIAKQDLLSALEMAGKQEKGFFIVENTDRYSLFRLWDTMFPVGETEYARRGYVFPFWESSARMAETESFYWWMILLTSLGSVLFSGLAIYVGHVKKKFSEQIQEIDVSFTS